MTPRTRNLERAGLSVFALLAMTTGANQWMAFQQLRSRMLAGIEDGLAAEFVLVASRRLACGAAIFLLGGLTLVGLLAWLGLTREPRRLLAVLLIALAPMLPYALGISVAFLTGWQLDAWVLAARGATAKEVAGTIQEAIPVVLDPAPSARYVAVGLSAILAVVLQRRLCGVRALKSSLVAASYCAVAHLSGLIG